ncbi:MAG: magnesium transporter [Candidatus Bathyarchaeota archaeon]|nr:magnesium transporter [Candidatus Bathyarchaeota archaeon]MDH5745812.1 magnesium transporter [Candidatus Bathyarchaeota archaeon]
MKLANISHYFGRDALSPRFLKEALIAFSFNIGGILAGFIVASQLNVFQLSPWAIAVYPAILTARGVISGLFSGRLSTALHIGTIHPRLRGNTKSFYMLFKSLIVITLETSVAMSLVSMIFGSLFWGITFADFSDILIVILATMILGLTNSLFTVEIAFISFKKGLDPDVIVYPIMSTVADIVITLCYVFALNLFFLSGFVGRYIVIFLGAALIILALDVLPRCIHDQGFVKTIKESLLTLVFVAFVVNVTGTILKNISEIVGSRKEIYTVYPALIDTVGDVGSVVGSTATTKLALGLLKPSFDGIRNHATRISATWTASIIMFTVYSILSLFTQGTFTLHAFLGFASVLLITNIIAVSAIVLVSYAVAILTFKKGLDPDNFVIPIESSLADGITSIALLVALVLANYMVYGGV